MVLTLSAPMFADSEGGLLLEAGASKKLTRKLNMSLESELRTRENFKTVDRVYVGLGAQYKLTGWLKADAGYKLLITNFREDYDVKKSGKYKHWRPSYWGIRHRFYASLVGSQKFFKTIKLELRERWEYTYRPEKTVQRWDYDDETWEDNVRTGKAKSVLRSRLTVAYDHKRAFFTPFASIELYNAWAIEKIRYTVGTDLNLSEHHGLSVFYRYQNMKNVDDGDYDPDMHYLGIGYKFRF